MERKGPATYDPGWNDPPTFSFESQSTLSKGSKPRTFLNKRVAFPLQASPPVRSSSKVVDPTAPLPPCSLSSLPPPPAGSSPKVVDPTAPLPPCSLSSLPPPPVSSISQTKESTDNPLFSDDFDSKQALDIVVNNLLSQLHSHELEEKHKTDIQRRLDTLKKMWSENKLNKDVQKRLLELAESLNREDVERADYLHKGLMVDHATVCSPWMSGVRHLIHRKQPTPETTSD